MKERRIQETRALTSWQGTEGAGLHASRGGWPAGRDGPFPESGLGEHCQVSRWYNKSFLREPSSKDAELLTGGHLCPVLITKPVPLEPSSLTHTLQKTV